MTCITEQFIDHMRAKGWTCTDCDELQFAKIHSLDELRISITQVDYSDKSEAKGGHLVTPPAKSVDDLESSLIEEEFTFACANTLVVEAVELDIYDIEDYTTEDLLTVVAEREFEANHATIAPNRMAG